MYIVLVCTGSTTSTFICFTGCSVEGQVQQTCRTCPATCSNPGLICRAVCEFGCGCPPGQLIDTTINKCVDPKECPLDCSVSNVHMYGGIICIAITLVAT